MQNRRAVIVCAVLVLVGCWMLVSGPGGDPVDEDRAIKRTVAEYVDAFVSGDGRAACDFLTEDARRAVIDAAGRVGAASCPDAFERTRKLGGKQVRAVAQKIEVGKIDRNGDTARVTLRAAGVDSVADLQKVGDHWRIASLPKA